MENERSNRIENQVEIFKKGIPMLKLNNAAKVGDGIKKVSINEAAGFERIYNDSTAEVEKFVPASGAATRMFKDLLSLRSEGTNTSSTDVFFKSVEKVPFGLQGSDPESILAEMFSKRKVEQLPKGLLPFHRYGDKTRTGAEEHLAEGLAYAEKNGIVKLHFTVSPEHLDRFKDHLDEASTKFSVDFEISYSTQNPKTDTVAVDLNNVPFQDDNNKTLFRPAGHGAILENLNQLDSDIIFIKNIDNVVPDRLKKETVLFKKVLAGVLLHYQQKAFDLLKRIEAGEDLVYEVKRLLEEMGSKGEFSKEELVEKLNRPIRVCGMVKNQGEPGGGPFWVRANDGSETLQIVESAQIDLKDSEQEAIFKQSTHFNPVDLVCGVKDYNGSKFDLIKYRDTDTGFISQKSFKGQPIKALELPGLWNGSMADWNTIFVEVPLITFNPVKTVNDLLRDEHQE